MKAKQINKILGFSTLLLGVLFVAKRRTKGASGIGAAKRRVFKELSLAQKAGVDFTKRYDELTPSEIKALQKVSNDTGYTETYYKSLKKAYDAISGIGEAYDVVNADGDTVLTWIEDPDGSSRAAIYNSNDDDAERYRALLDAREIEADRDWEQQEKARRRDELEAQLAEQRKRLKKAGRSSQMVLFGVGGDQTYSKQQLDSYLGSYHITELVAEAVSKNKLHCSVGDEKGGRDFYLGHDNFMYFFNYCLIRNIPIALWNGARWITRNGGEKLLSDPDIETELFEIWRELLEYGDTDYDFDTWKRIYGDEYIKSSILPYM